MEEMKNTSIFYNFSIFEVFFILFGLVFWVYIRIHQTKIRKTKAVKTFVYEKKLYFS